MRIFFVYNPKCARRRLDKLLRNGGRICYNKSSFVSIGGHEHLPEAVTESCSYKSISFRKH